MIAVARTTLQASDRFWYLKFSESKILLVLFVPYWDLT
jgi:hypothetical protein